MDFFWIFFGFLIFLDIFFGFLEFFFNFFGFFPDFLVSFLKLLRLLLKVTKGTTGHHK